MQKFPGQGLKPNHSCNPSQWSDNARSLTCWATRELWEFKKKIKLLKAECRIVWEGDTPGGYRHTKAQTFWQDFPTGIPWVLTEEMEGILRKLPPSLWCWLVKRSSSHFWNSTQIPPLPLVRSKNNLQGQGQQKLQPDGTSRNQSSAWNNLRKK